MKLVSIESNIAMTLILGVSIFCAGPVSAQDNNDAVDESNGALAAESDNEETVLEEVVVTGIRGAYRAQIEAKRTNAVISDSIATTDIGELPDFNVAEALSRVAGVSTEQSRGEDRYVTVRGLQSAYSYVSIDGAIIPGTDQSARSIPMDIFPSSLVSGIDIYKSFNASMDGNAIGSHIDMKTRSAFEVADRYLRFDGSLGWYEKDDGPNDADQSYTIKATYSDTFGADDNWGVVLSASAYNRENYTDLPAVASTRIDWYDDSGNRYSDPAAPEHNGYPVPQGGKHFLYFNDRERYGAFAKLEYKNSENTLRAFASGFYYNFYDEENRYGVIIERNRSHAPENQTLNSGHMTTGKLQSEVIGQVFEFDVSGLQAELEYDITDTQLLSIGLNKSNGKYAQPYLWSKFDTGRIPELSYTYHYGEGYQYPAVTLDDSNYYDDPSNFTFAYHRDRSRDSDEDVTEGRLDYVWENIADSDWAFSGGLKMRDMNRKITRYDDEFKLTDRSDFTLDQAIYDYRYTPHGINTPMYLVDPALVQAFVEANLDLFKDNSTNNALNRFRNNYNVDEDILAGYLMLDYYGENLHLNVGYRIEDTDYSTSGYQKLKENGETSYVPITYEQKYTSRLPSFGLTYWFHEDLAFRAAFSETIGRPSYHNLRPTESRTVTEGDGTPGDPDIISVSGGNTGLDPRESSNYDLSMEYYFAEGDGLFSVGFFHKDIENDIFTLKTEVETVIDGVSTIMKYSRPENLESSEVTGLEVNFVLTQFDFLPGLWKGFGVNVNYTHLDGKSKYVNSSGEVRDPGLYGMLKQPENIWNASLKYTYEAFEGRIAYKNHDLRLESINSDYARDRLHAPRNTVDLQLRYHLTDSVFLKLDAKNITDSSQQSVNSDRYQFPVWERDYGRSYWLGLSYRPF